MTQQRQQQLTCSGVLLGLVLLTACQTGSLGLPPLPSSTMATSQSESETLVEDNAHLEEPQIIHASVRQKDKRESPSDVPTPSTLPPQSTPSRLGWWQKSVNRPLGQPKMARSVTLQSLILLALTQSPQVHAISQQGLIQETAITEALAEFDVRSFAESKLRQSSDPVGNTLITGGPLRFRETDYYYRAGVRKKVELGGTIELAQQVGVRENNSRFFDPRNQGNAQLSSP